MQQQHGHHHNNACHQHGLDDAQQVRQAGEQPQPAIQAAAPE
jgi:hypothetical protein